MVTTRSGRTTAGAAPRPHTTKPRRPAKKHSPIGGDHPPAPPPGPIARLPIEIFYLIVRLFLSIGDGPTSMASAPRPSQLYPLATTCKGFWGCLRPLLFKLDVNFITKDIKPKNVALLRWHQDFSRGPRTTSALAWGLANGYTSIAQSAVEAAQSLGKLESYISDVNFCAAAVPDPCSSWENRWEKLRDAQLDPLSLAIVVGDTKMVKILAKEVDASLLCRVWPDSSIGLSYSIRCPMTPLHLAIWMEQYEVTKILLQRFAEVDQTTLEWYELVGLGFASYLGYIEIARLILEGEKGAVPESPWVARIRSQLVDPRAYSRRKGARQRHSFDFEFDLSLTPPMLLASLGSGNLFQHPGGEAIFALLATQDPHLVTKKYSYVPSGSPETPLGVAMVYSKYLLPSAESYILALVRAGALEPSPLLSPRVNQAPSHRLMLSHLLNKELKWTNRRQFIGKCWDAALEYHGGTADDEFLKSWEEGIGNGLPIMAISKVGMTPVARKSLVWKLTLILHIISVLDRKSPGFAQLPVIRGYLDHWVFHRRNDNTFSYVDLEDNWTHLMAS